MRLESVRRLLARMAEGRVEPETLESDDSLTDSERELGAFALPLFRDRVALAEERGELAAQVDALRAALDQVPFAALVLAPSGRLLALSRALQNLLGGDAAPVSLVKEAHLAARGPQRGAERVATVETRAGDQLTLRLIAPETLAPGDAAASVVFAVPTGSALPLDRERLAARHGLTTRECDAIGWAAHGLTNREIALRMDVTADTIRSHLYSAMMKTGSRNRAGLVALAIGLFPATDVVDERSVRG